MLTVSRRALDFSGFGGIWHGPSHSGNVYCGQTNQYFRSCLEGMETVCQEQGHPDCYRKQLQKPGSVMVWACVSVLGKGTLNFCDGTINAEKSTQRFWSNLCCLQDNIFFRDAHAYFNEIMENHILHTLQRHGCRRKVWGCWTGLQSRPVPNRECMAHFERQNATTKIPYCYTS